MNEVNRLGGVVDLFFREPLILAQINSFLFLLYISTTSAPIRLHLRCIRISTTPLVQVHQPVVGGELFGLI